MKTYNINHILIASLITGSLAYGLVRLWMTSPIISIGEPKFKAGDCIAEKSQKGEFLELSDRSMYRLILQVGKKNYLYQVVYLGDHEGDVKSFGDPNERPIESTDPNFELTSTEFCKQTKPKFKAGDCIVIKDDAYTCFLIEEILDDEYIVQRDGFCKTKLSKKQKSKVARIYLESDSTITDPSHCK
jgi:hypothetical protein